MTFGKIVASGLLAGAVAVGGTAVAQKSETLDFSGLQLAASEERDDDRREYEGEEYADDDKTGSDERLSLMQVTQLVSEKGYTDIREVEREDGHYEVEARDEEGRWVELYVDGRTGEIVRSEVE